MNNSNNPLLNKWHILKYLIIEKIPNKEEYICINLLIGKYCLLSSKQYNSLLNFRKLSIDDSDLKYFIQQGLLIKFDEYALLEARIRNAKTNNSSASLTICPTVDCNFNCPYCFENHIKGKMSKETQNDLLLFIKRYLNKFKIKSININWYGGEPLLALDVIENLSKNLISLCKENDIKYSAKIFSNGYLLNQKTADLLASLEIKKYQITLDGIENTHDLTRHLINGEKTYKKIINNLEQNKIEGIITIRHNVYEKNFEEIGKLQELIKKISHKSGNNIRYYSALVVDNEVSDKRNKKVNILEKNKAYKISIDHTIGNFQKIKNSYCCAQNINSIIVDAKGNLYKCWEDVDKIERSYGDIKTWNINNPFYSAKSPNILVDYLNTKGAFHDEECQNCIWLPFCLGGCPNKALFYKKACLVYKDHPEIFALEIYNKYCT